MIQDSRWLQEVAELPNVYCNPEASNWEPPAQRARSHLVGRRTIGGWPSGTAIDSEDTLNLSALAGVRSLNEVFPLELAAEAYERMMSGHARFRVVLTTRA